MSKASILLACALLILRQAEAGPTGLIRIVREVYPEIEPENEPSQTQVCIMGDVVYGPEETVPAEQPCLKCRCQPPSVLCETIQCTKQPGCKAIHRPNKCCPDYECECLYNGKIYGNGERLETSPGGECKVCYCRGGEVQCAEVSCYIRNDCEGKKVPGQCCPKYDHCPPIDSIQDKTTTEPTFREETSTPTPVLDETQNRIPDTEDTPPKDIKKETKITIQEIIPEIKEIPITAPPKPEKEEPFQLVIEEQKPELFSQPNDLDIEDSETDSSEISQVFQHPPPVLRIGDKLLYLKQNEENITDSAPVITIIGAEGLQRGFEDSLEVHEEKTDPPQDLEPKSSASTHILSLVRRKSRVTTQASTSLIDLISSSEPTTTPEPEKREPLLKEQNPAYPPIPDIMTAHTEEPLNILNETQTEAEPKILPQVLTIRSNKTIPENVTNQIWLKNLNESNESKTLLNVEATLPEQLLKEKSPIDEAEDDNTTSTDLPLTTTSTFTENITELELETETETTVLDSSTEPVTEEPSRSVESLETTESTQELTTASNHSSLILDLNASIESDKETDLEAVDMLKADQTIPEEVELIDEENKSLNKTTKDVETINIQPETTHTELPQLEKMKIVGKRENSPEAEADEVFKQLNDELNVQTTERIQSRQEEEEEAGQIFKELLEETSSPRTNQNGPEGRNKDSETLQRVSDALAKFTLRGKQPNSNILGTLINFFSSQYSRY